MKGILCVGGAGKRLQALTKVLNKHIIPVGLYPMVYHPLHTLKEAGYDDIIIISGKEHMGTLISQLGSGADFNMKFTYRIQDSADGIAGALKLCEDFIKDKQEHFPVLLGDNIFLEDLDLSIPEKSGKGADCKVFLKKVSDPFRFGVAVFERKDNKDIISQIVEKPQEFIGMYVVTGAYVYDNNLWDILRNLSKSDRGEYEISDVNNWYIRNGSVAYDILQEAWTDAGTHKSLIKANNLCKDIIYDWK